MTQSLLPLVVLGVVTIAPLALAWIGRTPLRQVLSWLVPCVLAFAVGLFLLPSPLDVVVLVVASLFWIAMIMSASANRLWSTFVLREERAPFPRLPGDQQQFVDELGSILEDLTEVDFFSDRHYTETLDSLHTGLQRLRSLSAPTDRWAAIQTQAIDVVSATATMQQTLRNHEGETEQEVRSTLRTLWLNLLEEIESARRTP